MALPIEVDDNARLDLFRLNNLGGREPQVERIGLSIKSCAGSRQWAIAPR
jgi:hypothetical protein